MLIISYLAKYAITEHSPEESVAILHAVPVLVCDNKMATGGGREVP